MAEPHPQTSAAPRAVFSAFGAWLPWLTLAAFACGAAALVLRFGVNVPFFDEWDDTVPRLTGAEPVTPAWLWSPHNEHRIPLPRLLLLAFLRLGGGDFRVAMLLNLAVLVAATAALLSALRHLRPDRRLRAADAVVPALVLTFGGAQNWVWAFQIQFIAAVALVLVALAAALRMPAGEAAPSPGASAVAGACVLLLPLCGANGLAFAAPLGLWLLYRGAAAVRAGTKGAAPTLLLASGAATLALCAAYFVGLNRAPSDPPQVSPLSVAAEFLAMALGGGTQGARPDEGSGLTAASVAALLLLAALAVVAVGAAWGQRAERPRALAAGAVLLGVLAMAAGVAAGRAAFGPGAGLASRYALPAALLPVCVYLLLVLGDDGAAGRRTRARRLAMGVLCAVVVVLAPVNVLRGWRIAEEQGRAAASFLAMARAGLPLSALTSVGVGRVHNNGESLNLALRRMRGAGVAPFATLPDDPRVRALPLRPREAQTLGIEPASDGSLRPTRADGGLAWRFATPPDAFAVLVRYRTATPFVPGAAYRIAAVPADGAADIPEDWRDGLVDRLLPQAPDGAGAVLYPCRALSGVEVRVVPGQGGALPPALVLEEVVVMVRREGADVAETGGRGTAGAVRN